MRVIAHIGVVAPLCEKESDMRALEINFGPGIGVIALDSDVGASFRREVACYRVYPGDRNSATGRLSRRLSPLGAPPLGFAGSDRRVNVTFKCSGTRRPNSTKQICNLPNLRYYFHRRRLHTNSFLTSLHTASTRNSNITPTGRKTPQQRPISKRLRPILVKLPIPVSSLVLDILFAIEHSGVIA